MVLLHSGKNNPILTVEPMEATCAKLARAICRPAVDCVRSLAGRAARVRAISGAALLAFIENISVLTCTCRGICGKCFLFNEDNYG